MIRLLTHPLYQWDTGRMAMIIPRPGTTVEEVHCHNKTTDDAVTLIIDSSYDTVTCKIPDTFLTTSNDLVFYAVMKDDTGKYTTESAMFKIHKRPKPDDYVYTEDEIKTWESIRANIDKLERDVKNLSENGNVNLTGVVKSVNGTVPDENGNVEITIPDSGGNVELDTTLTEAGKAADAKAVGDEFTTLKTLTTVVEAANDAGYIRNDGVVMALKDSNIYKPIKLLSGDTIRFVARGYQSIVAVLSKTDENGSYYSPIIVPAENTEIEHEYTANQDGYYALCSMGIINKITVVYTRPLEKLSEEISELYGGTVETTEAVTYSYNGYVHKSGYLSPLSGYDVSDVIRLNKGDTIRFDSAIYDASVIWALSRWSEDGNTFVKGLFMGSVEAQTIEYTASTAVEYLRITQDNRRYPVGEVTISRMVKRINERVDDIEKTIVDMSKYDCFPFIRVGVVGDSMASGATNFEKDGTVTTADRPAYSWGKFMEREHGVDVSLFSEGGTSTRTWLTRSTGLSAMNSAEPCDCYIIGLGLNESALWGMEYIGTDADVNIGNENSNADTMYGNYSKIIAALTAKSPRCKVFCLTMPGTSDLHKSFNIAIRNVAAMYDNAHVIDLEGDPYFECEGYKKLWYYAHSTAGGYKSISGHLWKRMNEYIATNASDFLDVQWIFENHS